MIFNDLYVSGRRNTTPPPPNASRPQMHENKYLHLPVVDEEEGTVVGVVNVMEIVQATAGDKGSSRYALSI